MNTTYRFTHDVVEGTVDIVAIDGPTAQEMLSKLFNNQTRSLKMTLAIYLKESRENANKSQKDVSDALQYATSQFISNWERGVSRPPKTALKTLIGILALDPTTLKGLYRSELYNDADQQLKDKFQDIQL